VVSVLMPVRNVGPYVAEAIRSVLDQHGVDLELIVVFDVSTDNSLDVVSSFTDPRVRVLEGPRRGIGPAVNVALDAARGDLVIRCDADDLLPVDRLAWQTAWMADHPEFGAVCGYFSTITSTGQAVADLARTDRGEEITEELRSGVTRTHLGTFAIRTAILREMGGHRKYFVTAEDIDLALRLGERTRVWYEPKHLYIYRLHDSSITHSQVREEREFFENTAREFQRQRLATGADDLDRGRPPRPPERHSGRPSKAWEQIQGFLTNKAWSAYESGARVKALLLGARAFLVRPTHREAWRNIVVLTIKCLWPGRWPFRRGGDG